MKIRIWLLLFFSAFISLITSAQSSLIILSKEGKINFKLNSKAIDYELESIQILSNDSLVFVLEGIIDDKSIRRKFDLPAGEYFYVLIKDSRGNYKFRIRDHFPIEHIEASFNLKDYPNTFEQPEVKAVKVSSIKQSGAFEEMIEELKQIPHEYERSIIINDYLENETLSIDQLVESISYLNHDFSKWSVVNSLLDQYSKTELKLLENSFKSENYKSLINNQQLNEK